MAELYTVTLTLSNIPDELYEDFLTKVEDFIIRTAEDMDFDKEKQICCDVGIGMEQEEC